MEESTIFNYDQYHLYSSDYSLDWLNFQSFHESHDYPQNIFQSRDSGVERPAKQQKRNSNWKSCNPEASLSSSSRILTFEESESSQASFQKVYGLGCAMNTKREGGSQGNYINSSSSISLQGLYYSPENVQETKRISPMTKTTLHAEDHVIAERKRREKLNQQLIALSALIPGLKRAQSQKILCPDF